MRHMTRVVKTQQWSLLCRVSDNLICFILFFFSSSAFFIFCSEFRPKVKGETPGLTIGEVAKRLGEMWNGTASEDKQPYEKKAAKLKEKYEKVKKCFQGIHVSQIIILSCCAYLITVCFFHLYNNSIYFLFHHRKLPHIAKRPKEELDQQEKPRLR